MTSFRTAFPSKYLKADDLGTARPIGTITACDLETVGSGDKQERKLVLRFEEIGFREKGLVLNLINSETLTEIIGSDQYEDWVGHQVQLYATKTEFSGKRVPCIRICAPPQKALGDGPKRDEEAF